MKKDNLDESAGSKVETPHKGQSPTVVRMNQGNSKYLNSETQSHTTSKIIEVDFPGISSLTMYVDLPASPTVTSGQWPNTAIPAGVTPYSGDQFHGLKRRVR